MAIFRYPGGKRKLRKLLVEKLDCESKKLPNNYEYREPFFGGGSIGVEFAKNNNPSGMWINDRDLGIACIWTAVIRCPELLKQKILKFVPSVEAFDEFRDALKNGQPNIEDDESVSRFGFMKIAVHQLSYSGLGLRSGGPLGGRSQASPYKIDCRWSPEYIYKKMMATRDILLARKFVVISVGVPTFKK